MVPLRAWIVLALGGCSNSTVESAPAGTARDASTNGYGGASGESTATASSGGPEAGTGAPPIATGGTALPGGGETATGGTAAAGGTMAAGGMPATGGITATGGALSTPTSSGTASGGATGFGGSPGNADAGTASDASRMSPDAFVPCTVNIVPWSTPSFLNLVPGDTATLAVKGTIAWGSSTPTLPNWQWTVKGPDGTPLAITNVPTTDQTMAIVQFPLLAPGGYSISVSATPVCKGQASATAVKPQERSQAFFIRILPPPAASANSGQTCDTGSDRWCPSQDAVPYEDANFMLQAGQPRQGNVQLLRGYAVSIDPAETAQPDATVFPAVAVPSYIRVSPHGSTWTIDGASTSDQPLLAMLNPQLIYDVLVVPQADASGTVFPPFLVASELAQEFRPDDFDVAAGVTLQGTLTGPGGPVAGARLLLDADATAPVTLPLPSTVGGADSTGAYSLRTSAGSLFSAVVVPPSGSSLPQVTIADCIDLRTATNGTTLDQVNFTWNTVSTTTMTLQILMSDNSPLSESITVRLQSQDGALPNPGILTVAGASAGTGSGSVRLDGTTDANGSIAFANIPNVAYRLTLIPPSDLAGAAITSATIDLSSATASSTRTLILGQKVKLSGRLLPANVASGAQLIATDTGTDVLVSVISTPVQSDGSYQFLADPGRTYRFSVEPAAGNSLPTRIPLYGVTTTNQDTTLADRTLPTGLSVSGIVSFSGLPVAGAIVQAYCEESGIADCVDPSNPSATLPPPLVEFATLPDGSYSFYLLDPAGGDVALP